MSGKAIHKRTSKDWFFKALAGLVLGYALAIGLSGWFAWFGPGGHWAGTGKTQFTMWLVAPLWCLILSLCFLFRNGRSAWLWLGGATLVVYAMLYGGRWLILQGGAA